MGGTGVKGDGTVLVPPSPAFHLVPSWHRPWIDSNPFRGAGALQEDFLQPQGLRWGMAAAEYFQDLGVVCLGVEVASDQQGDWEGRG